MDPSKTLPPELWFHILDFATYHPWLTVVYSPFQYVPFHGSPSQDVLNTRLAIVCVCKLWNAIGSPLLYQDIFVRHDIAALKDVLVRNPSLHCWIKSVCLPYISSETHGSDTPGSSIDLTPLVALQNVVALTRPYYRNFSRIRSTIGYDFTNSGPFFPGLKRLDWWHSSSAARSGGIDRLPDVIARLPGLEYLSVSGYTTTDTPWSTDLTLPELKTLHIRDIDPGYARDIMRWKYPALRNLVLESIRHTDALTVFHRSLSSQVECVELGPRLRHLIKDYVSLVVEEFPLLQELSYHIFYTSPPHWPNNLVRASLRRIRLHSRPNAVLEGKPLLWDYIMVHLRALANRDVFPALSEVYLYGGDWFNIPGNPDAQHEISRVKEFLTASGISCTLVGEH